MQVSKMNDGEKDQSPTRFTAIVLAGSRVKHDPLAEAFGEEFKALIPVDGTPMVERVVTALSASPHVEDIIIIFDYEDELYAKCPDLKNREGQTPLRFMPCSTSICDSVWDVVEAVGTAKPFLITTADHALLRPDIIDAFCEGATEGQDLAVGFVERHIIEAFQPGSKRTYLPFKGAEISGANLFAFMTPEAKKVLPFWKRVERERKKPWKLFSAFGYRNLFGLLFKLYTIKEAFSRASKVIGLETTAICLPYAQAAIDVDSLKDHEQVTAILEKAKEL